MVWVLHGEAAGGKLSAAGVQREVRMRDTIYRRHNGAPQFVLAEPDATGPEGQAVRDLHAAARDGKRAVLRTALAERKGQDEAEAEREKTYWPVRVQKGERPALQPGGNADDTKPAARGLPPRAGEHPRSLLTDSERVHGPSKGLPIWNAGKCAYEPYALLSADLNERPNFNLLEARTRSVQPFKANYPLPVPSRDVYGNLNRAPPDRGLTAQRLRQHDANGADAAGLEAAPTRAEPSELAPRAPLDAFARSRQSAKHKDAAERRAPPSPPSSVGAPTTLAPEDNPPAYLAGRMAYSTNRRPASAREARPAAAAAALQVRPPVAGALAPRASPADTAFRRAKDFGDVPLSLVAGGNGPPVQWILAPREIDRRLALAAAASRSNKPLAAAVSVPRYTCEQLLVLCCEGLRELELAYHLLAVHGATELVEHLSSAPDPHALLPVVPQLVAPLKTALSTRQPLVVSAALKLLQQIASTSPRAAAALLPGLPSLLPLVALWVGATATSVARDGEMEWAQHRRVNLGVLAEELLEIVARACGPEGARLVRSFVPTFSTAASAGAARVQTVAGGVAGFSQRGFDAPGRGQKAAVPATATLRRGGGGR